LIAEAFGDNPKLVEAVTRGIPMGRMAEPDEIASAVAFLVSDDARFITGQTLSVSGGLTMC
jgi:2-hydroxycyclohexanecarboxyl-CoA dehydrogenase